MGRKLKYGEEPTRTIGLTLPESTIKGLETIAQNKGLKSKSEAVVRIVQALLSETC